MATLDMAAAAAGIGSAKAAAAALKQGKKQANRTDAFIRYNGSDAARALLRKSIASQAVRVVDGNIRGGHRRAFVLTVTLDTARVPVSVTFADETGHRFAVAVKSLTVDVPNRSYRVTA